MYSFIKNVINLLFYIKSLKLIYIVNFTFKLIKIQKGLKINIIINIEVDGLYIIT